MGIQDQFKDKADRLAERAEEEAAERAAEAAEAGERVQDEPEQDMPDRYDP